MSGTLRGARRSAVVHGYNFAPENKKDELAQQLADILYYGVHMGFQPRGQEQWVLEYDRFLHGADPDLLAHALFAESQTDACIYHGIPLYGMTVDGGSPLWVGKAMRERYPGRVLLYGPISPWQPGAIEEVDRLVEEDGIVGLKLYPMDRAPEARVRDEPGAHQVGFGRAAVLPDRRRSWGTASKITHRIGGELRSVSPAAI